MMLSKTFQRKLFNIYKADHDDTYRHGNYEYSIAYNACSAFHTWIIRRKRTLGYGGEWHWLQPLDTEIN